MEKKGFNSEKKVYIIKYFTTLESTNYPICGFHGSGAQVSAEINRSSDLHQSKDGHVQGREMSRAKY